MIPAVLRALARHARAAADRLDTTADTAEQLSADVDELLRQADAHRVPRAARATLAHHRTPSRRR